MITFDELTRNIKSLQSQNDFSQYLESSLIEIEAFFISLNNEALNELKFDIEDLLYDLQDRQLVKDKNNAIVNAFLILLAQKFEQAGLIGAIVNLLNYLPQGGVKKRLEAAKLYLRVNDISTDYFTRFDAIMRLIADSVSEDEEDYKAVCSALYYYLTAFAQFYRLNNASFVQALKKLFEHNQKTYRLLSHPLMHEVTSNLSLENYTSFSKEIKAKIDALIPNTQECTLQTSLPCIEQSTYSKTLYDLPSPSFEKLREIAYVHVKAIGDPNSLYEGLLRGEAIIDSEDLLFKYMVSFGAKHKAKLYSAFDAISNLLNQQSVNVIDWGCGQALASIAFLEYIRDRNIDLDVRNICLIEPSLPALNRGLLHVDVFKNSQCNVVAINSDLDCLKKQDLFFDKKLKTIHLFSNILDVEGFALNYDFFEKVAFTLQNDALFICVSPNINDKRNTRLDLFYKHFDENFNTELLSFRDSDVNGHRRYERIFEVKPTAIEVIEEKQEQIQQNYQFDIIKELNQYKDHVTPILDLKMLEHSINSDPEYIIFKIRKVAEVITSNIYALHEDNGQIVSFNDKIRYLAYQKNVFDKSITNYVQTIRTVGNRGVHEADREISHLRLDAHLTAMALISFLNELMRKKLI